MKALRFIDSRLVWQDVTIKINSNGITVYDTDGWSINKNSICDIKGKIPKVYMCNQCKELILESDMKKHISKKLDFTTCMHCDYHTAHFKDRSPSVYKINKRGEMVQVATRVLEQMRCSYKCYSNRILESKADVEKYCQYQDCHKGDFTEKEFFFSKYPHAFDKFAIMSKVKQKFEGRGVLSLYNMNIPLVHSSNSLNVCEWNGLVLRFEAMDNNYTWHDIMYSSKYDKIFVKDSAEGWKEIDKFDFSEETIAELMEIMREIFN